MHSNVLLAVLITICRGWLVLTRDCVHSHAAAFYAVDILMQLHAGFVLKGWDEKRQGELQAQLWVVATDVARLWLLLRVLTPPNTCH